MKDSSYSYPEEEDNKNEIDLNQIEICDSENTLSMTRLPWSLWGLSMLSLFGASFLLGNLLSNKKAFDGYQGGYWWQYLIIVFMYVFGFIIFLCGKVEVVCFDKEAGLFTQNKWIVCYKWKSCVYGLNEIANVGLQKEGVKNTYQDTIHYKVTVVLNQGLPMRILETKNRIRAIEKATQIRKFLGMSEKFTIRDLSTL